MKRTILFLFCFFLSVSMVNLFACGYKIAPSTRTPNYAEVNGSIKESDCKFVINTRNKTFVSGLEDRMRYILTEELIRRGCANITNCTMAKAGGFGGESKCGGSELKSRLFYIEGVITDVNMNIVAERSGQIALYEVIINTFVTITTPDGKVISKNFSSPFISDFKSGARIEEIILARDREIEKVLRDIAIEIIEELK
jgi:hypothetical protein